LLLDGSAALVNSHLPPQLHQAITEIAAQFPDRGFLRELQTRADAHLSAYRAKRGQVTAVRENLGPRLPSVSFNKPVGVKKTAVSDNDEEEDVGRSIYMGMFAGGIAFILFFLPISLMSSLYQEVDFFEVLVFAKL